MSAIETETCIDFIHADKVIYISTGRKAYINKIKKWKEKFPNLVNIIKENSDGSIYVSVPKDWFRFPIPSRKDKNNLKEEI